MLSQDRFDGLLANLGQDATFAQTRQEAGGQIAAIVQGQLSGDTVGNYDPTTKTITVDSRKFDKNNVALYFNDTVSHEVKHGWQYAILSTFGSSSEKAFPFFSYNGKTYSMETTTTGGRGGVTNGFNMSRPYNDRRHEMDARAFGAQITRAVNGTTVNTWELLNGFR